MSRQPPPPGANAHTVAARLRVTTGELVRAARTTDALPPTRAAVLDLLDRRGPMTTADLAAARQVRHQTMATTVKELVSAGHVTAVPDAHDGRKKVLHLTSAGQDALDHDRENRVGRLGEALARALGPGELQDLADALTLIDRVTAAMSVHAETPGAPDRGPVTGGC
ncbi:MarR family winged helix-turn-helix transcriptional regulator [Streptomyces sp. NRRL F-5123]|uniref:MarR family winged helix-turn-helix transcriptional regulator n=1 Tax=Streptomyces sp. NRRL F-5123 TaxID=1463856 RepID=UPI0006946F09|nr:MarR family transcriptional regulator [Streptomyces sp. NRRL F-5123]